MTSIKKKQRVLIFSGGYGHLSQAKALKEIFSSHFGAKNIKLTCLVDKIAPSLYSIIYIYFPSFFRLPFQASQFEKVRKIVKKYGKFYYQKRVEKEVKSFKPDIVFTTYFIFHQPLEELLQQGYKFQFFNVITDPITIHPVLYSSKAINFTYDSKGVKEGQKLKISKNQLIPFGWLVRKQFFRLKSTNQLREKLRLSPDLFTILICGGSEGTNSILKILPSLLKVEKPIQVIIVSGANTILYNIARSFEKLFSASFSVWKSQLKIKVYKFVKNMAPLMQASDLVIGKAGPNLLFETVACEKPFFAITHVHGQEDGNLWLIKKKKLGWVEEDGEKAARLLLKIINNPKMVHKFDKNILKEKNYLRSTENIILEQVKQVRYRNF